jgi:hypothetical protein
MYVEATKGFPDSNVKLKTKKGDAFMQKMDIFRRKLWYSYIKEPSIFIELNLDKVQEILTQNNKGKLPESLEMYVQAFVEEVKLDYENVVGQDSINRFDKISKSKKSNKKRHARSSSKQSQGAQKPKPKTGNSPSKQQNKQGGQKLKAKTKTTNPATKEKGTQENTKPKRRPSRQRQLLKQGVNKINDNKKNGDKKS